MSAIIQTESSSLSYLRGSELSEKALTASTVSLSYLRGSEPLLVSCFSQQHL